MTARRALAFIARHGVVLQAARGPVPNLAEFVAGEPIRGGWWAHAKGREIFQICGAIDESPDVLVCKLVDGKVTYVHRRLWPALVRLEARFPRGGLAKVWEEHTPSGAHRARRLPFPKWVPPEVLRESATWSVAAAEAALPLGLLAGRRRH